MDLKCPYIEEHKVWDNSFQFHITNFQDEDWYGIIGYANRHNCSIDEAKHYWNTWNPRLRNLINEGDVVFDCGAHHGHISIAASLIVGNGGKVISIEADDSNVQKLKNNISINNINNVEVIHNAVASISNIPVCIQYERVYPDRIPTVLTIKLDDLISYKPHIIKLDIEGFEVEALIGAEQILSLLKPKMEIEVHLLKSGVDIRQYGYYPIDLISILLDNNYTVIYNDKEVDYALFKDKDLELNGSLYCL